MFRQLVNAVSRKASAAKLPSAGSWLNASKPESVLIKQFFDAHHTSTRVDLTHLIPNLLGVF